MPATSFSDQFSSALRYEQYHAAGTEEQQRRWMRVYNIAQLDAPQQQLIIGSIPLSRSNPHEAFSPSATSRARSKIFKNIARVSFPVFVFCSEG